jgi:hypothetical protein
MRRITILAAVALLVCGTVVAKDGSPVPGAPWVQMAHSTQDMAKHLKPGLKMRPSVLLETEYYVYGWTRSDVDPPLVGPTEPQVNLTLQANGWDSAATLYLYRQDRNTGERLYYNLGAGWDETPMDLFGSAEPLPVWVPTLTDFQLFGPGGALGEDSHEGTNPETGHYMFVLEVRDAMGDETIARGYALYAFAPDLVAVSDNVEADTTWTNDNAYYLAAPIYVGGAPDVGAIDATLTIEPGTVVYGSKLNQGTLVVYPGAKIIADGTPLKPIIFTSEQPVGERAPGDWGGLVLSGNAPINVPGQLDGEGNSGLFGGDDPNDSSGVLRYVRVEFAGIRFFETNELNGIALQGVGKGTVVEHIQVHFNQDDGLEFFGGTCDAKYVLLTDARDDSLDWVHGWNGRLQHLVVLQRHNKADNGIEADNFEDGHDNTPRSMPTIYNATFIGNAAYINDPESEDSEYGQGMVLRRGTGGMLRNVIVNGFGKSGVRVDNSSTHALMGTDLVLDNSIIWGNQVFADGYTGSDADETLVNAFVWDGTMNQNANPMLANPFALIQPDVVPLEGSPARDGSFVAAPPDDGFFEPVDYIGGVNPSDPWIWDAWTTFSDN